MRARILPVKGISGITYDIKKNLLYLLGVGNYFIKVIRNVYQHLDPVFTDLRPCQCDSVINNPPCRHRTLLFPSFASEGKQPPDDAGYTVSLLNYPLGYLVFLASRRRLVCQDLGVVNYPVDGIIDFMCNTSG